MRSAILVTSFIARRAGERDQIILAESYGKELAQFMTTRQKQILDFVRQFMVEKGCPPTRNEIRLAFGFSSANAAEEHLRALERHGALILVPGISRGIRLPVSISGCRITPCPRRGERSAR